MAKILVSDAVRIIPRDAEFLNRKTGLRGEIFYDQTANTLRIYNGSSTGGLNLARGDLANVSNSDFRSKSVVAKLATVTYQVTVTAPQGGDTGNKYNLNGVYRPILNFVVGYTYVFVQDNPTNVYFPNANGTTVNQHPLNFSADNLSGNNGGGTSYLVDVQYFLDNVSVTQAVYNSPSFATAIARQVRITVTNSTPALLYYWCWNHLAMGNSIAVADPGSGTGSGGNSVSVDDTAPSSPSPGNLWLDTNTGILYVYYDDGNSEQWIQPVFPYPDTTNLATVSYVNSTVAALPASAGLATTSFVNSAVTGLASTAFVNSAVSAAAFSLNVEADDSTLRSVTSGSTVRFTGSGGITTTSDSSGNITIIGGGTTGNITFAVTTIDSSDSSAIRFTPAVIFDSDVTVQNNLVIDNSVDVASRLTVRDIILTGNFSSQGSGTPELFSDNEIYITPGTTTILNGLTTFYETTEVINTKTGATGTVVHDFSTGAVFYHSSLTANFTANFTNVPTTNNRSITVALILDQGATARIPNAVQIDGVSQTIQWSGGTTPSGTNNYVDVVNFTLIRANNLWIVLGSLSTYN